MKQVIIYIIMSLIFVLSTMAGYGQTESYYGWNGELKELHPIKGEFSVVLTEDNPQEFWTQMQAVAPSVRYQEIASKDGRHLYRLSAEESVENVQQLKNQISKRKGIARQTVAILPVFDGGSQTLVPDNKFMIKLRDINDLEKLHELNKIHNVEIRTQYQSIPTMFSLQFTEQAGKDVFATARLYFENLDAEWSTPNFYRNWDKNGTITDPYFSYQYYMSQIRAPLAWDVSTGSDQVIVAVVDDGVMVHEDLPAGRILPGYAHDNGDEGPLGNEAHGMAVAGIIAASHNNAGIAGLAPEIEIMPVRIFGDRGQPVGDIDVSNAFDFAITNGAHIINNSWGVDPTDSEFEEVLGINQFIDDHSDDHLFVFSSGNDFNNNAIGYPAYLDGVFTVGAVDQSDGVQSYSSTGSEINLVAPSGGDLDDETSLDGCFGGDTLYSTITLNGNVWTLDQDGADGRNPGDTGTEFNCRNTYNWSMPQGLPTPGNGYSAHFGGTSAAAPQAAGVAALMLSVNPGLTISQIQTILQNTADQVSGMGGQGFTNEYGHGRLNVNEAVKEAMPNQYAGSSFSSSATLPDFSRIEGVTNLSSGVTLTIASGNVAVIEGSVSGSASTLAVNGRLIIEESSSLSNVHIDVGSGGELIVRKDATLAFAGGQGIEGNGPVSLEGTNAARITLLRTGGTNWDGVELHADNSTLHYVDITHAVNGVTSYNVSGLSVQNVEVFNSTWDGFRFINTSTASPAGGFGYLRAEANGVYGVYYDGGSNNELSTSIFKDNPSAGLYITGGASLEGVVNSRIYDGGTNGVRADNSSYLEITSCSIHDNAYREAFVFNNSTINATGNWWGQYPPLASQFEEVSGSSIDYSNALFFDPLPGSFQKMADGSAEQAAGSGPGEDKQQTTPESIETLADLRKALNGYIGVDALDELDRLYADVSPELSPWAQVIRMELNQRMGSHEQALQTGNALIAGGSTPSAVRKTAARRMFYSYLLGTRDVETAASMVALLEQWEEDEAEVNQLNRLLHRHGQGDGGTLQNHITRVALQQDLDASNYPNPFNPVTEITYRLTENAIVNLTVYDLLGREVATLVDGEFRPAGGHSATFNASSLSSGMYLYRLQTANQVITRQMTLIK